MPKAPQEIQRCRKILSLGLPREGIPSLVFNPSVTLLGAIFLFTTCYVFLLGASCIVGFFYFVVSQSSLLHTYRERHALTVILSSFTYIFWQTIQLTCASIISFELETFALCASLISFRAQRCVAWQLIYALKVVSKGVVIQRDTKTSTFMCIEQLEKFDSSQLVLSCGYANIEVMLVRCCGSRNTCVEVSDSRSMHVW